MDNEPNKYEGLTNYNVWPTSDGKIVEVAHMAIDHIVNARDALLRRGRISQNLWLKMVASDDRNPVQDGEETRTPSPWVDVFNAELKKRKRKDLVREI